MTGHRLHGLKGMSLVEAVISMGIVSVMMVAALQMVGSAARTRQAQASHRRAPALARDLMAEILPNAYSEPDGVAVFGPEAGEAGGDRTAFDDVDDYNGWSSQPPQGKDAANMANLVGWRRAVVVEYVDPANVENVLATDTGLKRITVTVTDPQGRQTVRTALRSSLGVYENAPTQDTTYVTWVGVRFQTGADSSTKIISAANPLNRVPIQGQ